VPEGRANLPTRNGAGKGRAFGTLLVVIIHKTAKGSNFESFRAV